LVALLHYLANHGSDRLLISHRHRRDHRSELGPGRVRAQPNRVFLKDATPAFQQPLDIYAVLLGELSDLVMLELQDRLDLFVGKIARAMSLMRCRIASLNSRRCAIVSLLDRRTGCAARNAKSSAIARSIRSGFTSV
jgi:hypothetical protein